MSSTATAIAPTTPSTTPPPAPMSSNRARRLARIDAALTKERAINNAPTDDTIDARARIVTRDDNVAMVRSVATHVTRGGGHHDKYDIEQDLNAELLMARPNTSASRAVTLMSLPMSDPNRALARTVLVGMARNKVRATVKHAEHEWSSGMLTMGILTTTDQRDAVDAALASDGFSAWTDRDDAGRINSATAFAAAMGTATATARDESSHVRMANAPFVRRTREQTIGGREHDAKGIIRVVSEASLESMLTQTMRTHGTHGSDNDPSDSLAMRKWSEAFLNGPTPTSRGDVARRLANACDRLSERGARRTAQLVLAIGGSRMGGAEYGAWHAVATGQVKSWGTLVAACVKTTTPRKRGKRDDGKVSNETAETTAIVWATLLTLLGERANDRTAAKVAIAMTQTLARDAGAPHAAGECRRGVDSRERVASPTTRGGMAPFHRGDELSAWRGEVVRFIGGPLKGQSVAPIKLRVARHAAIDTRKVLPIIVGDGSDW